MFCTKCGTQVDQGDNFCKNCGVKIERRSATVISAAETAIAAPSRAPMPPAQPSRKADARGSTPNLKKGTTYKALIGAVGVAVLLISAAGLYFGRGSSTSVMEPAPRSQREEPRAAKILHDEALPSAEENKELAVAAETRPASVNRSEIVEAPPLGGSSKPAVDAFAMSSNSQAHRSGQDSRRNSRPAPEPASRGSAKPGVYETVHNTTVYENPSASATIVADIPAGVRVNVVSGSGDWLEVHSRRGNPPGFIRRGDAVFVESSN